MSNNVINFKRIDTHKQGVTEFLQELIDDPPDKVAVVAFSDDDDDDSAIVGSTFDPGKIEIIAIDTLLQQLTHLHFNVDIEE